jgi:hypothetical protein
MLVGGGASCSGSSHKTASPATGITIPMLPGLESPAATTTTSTTPTTQAPAPPTAVAAPRPVVAPGIAVGDSVLEDVQLYAPATLSAHAISVNAAVGRQWSVGIGILSALRAQGQLPPVVIVGLGSNGRITASLFDQMMQACTGAKRVVFMTVTGPLVGNNPIITAGVARYPSAVLADWHTLAMAHPAWFAADGVHMGPAGATALGDLLASLA